MTSVLNGLKRGATSAAIGESIADDSLIHAPYAGKHYFLGTVGAWSADIKEDPFAATVSPVSVVWPVLTVLLDVLIFDGAIYFAALDVDTSLVIYRWVPGAAPVPEALFPTADRVALCATTDDIYVVCAQVDVGVGAFRRNGGSWSTDLSAQLPDLPHLFIPALGSVSVGGAAYVVGGVQLGSEAGGAIRILKIAGNTITSYSHSILTYQADALPAEYAPVGGICAYGSSLFIFARVSGVAGEVIPNTGCRLLRAALSDLATWTVHADLGAQVGMTLGTPSLREVCNRRFALPWYQQLWVLQADQSPTALYKSAVNNLASWSVALPTVNGNTRSFFLVQ